MGRARVTGDRQREKTEDTPMPRACGCPPPSSSAVRSPSLQPVRSPCSVLRFLPSPTPRTFLSLTLSATLRRRASTRVCHFLSPLFAFFPLAVLVLAFPLLRARSSSAPSFLVPSRVYSFRRCSLLSRSLRRAFSLPPLYFFPSFSFPRGPTFLLRFFRIFFCFYLFHLPFHFPRPLPPPARAIARAVPPFLHSNLFLA